MDRPHQTEFPTPDWQGTLVWLSLDVLSAFCVYVTVVRMRDYGTTWIFGLGLAIVSSTGLAFVRLRSGLKWLVGLSLALTSIRLLTKWIDSTILRAPTMICIWCVSGLLVAVAILMATSVLHIPLWPDAQNQSKAGNRNSLLWIPVVLRPAGMFIVPLSLAVSIWGFHPSHLPRSCLGFTASATAVLACLAPLGYLLAPVRSLERKMRIMGLLPQTVRRINGRTLTLAFILLYFWGLSIEWRTTQEYLVWTVLALVSIVLALLFRSLLNLEHVELTPQVAAEAPWSRAVFILHALGLVLFSLIYGDLLFCIFR